MVVVVVVVVGGGGGGGVCVCVCACVRACVRACTSVRSLQQRRRHVPTDEETSVRKQGMFLAAGQITGN